MAEIHDNIRVVRYNEVPELPKVGSAIIEEGKKLKVTSVEQSPRGDYLIFFEGPNGMRGVSSPYWFMRDRSKDAKPPKKRAP